MTRNRVALAAALTSVAMVAALAVGCATPQVNDAPNVDPKNGAGLVSVLCVRCHNVQRIQAARKDRAGWVKTVSRMQTHGLHVTDVQRQSIIDYLTARDGAS